MINLAEIKKVCKVSGGIRRIQITDKDNIQVTAAGVTILDEELVYGISFRRRAASYEEELRDGRGGNYVDQKLSMFIPGKRADVEYIIGQLWNRRTAIIYLDHNGTGGFLYKAKMAYNYKTGQRLSNDHGYEMQFTTQSLKKSLDYSGIGIDLPDIGDPGYEDPGGGGGSGECCVVINPTPLATTPSVTGNTTNLNKFVKDPNGQTWFIDKDGRGLKFPSYPEYTETFTGLTGTRVYVTVGTLPTLNLAQKIQLFRNGQRLHPAATASDSLYFAIDHGTNELVLFDTLEAWEELVIYFNE
jgi:hypothetical protein